MTVSSKKLFLFDAYALIYRAHFAFIRNPRITSKGQNTSAIFGFLNALLDILNREKLTHWAVVFDPAGPTFRHDIFSDYKAHRDETPEDIKMSVPIIKSMLDSLNIHRMEVPGMEADDVIGTLAQKAASQGFMVYMVTPDKDYMQLVTDQIRMYKPATGGNGAEIFGVKEVCERFSVESPSQVIEILGLWGDAADNIPGCPGIGEKRAKEIIAMYGSIDNIYNHLDELKGKQKENVIAFKEQIMLSKMLATIVQDIDIEFNSNDYLKRKPNFEFMNTLFAELEFKNIANRLRELFDPAPMQGSLFDAPSTAVTSSNTEQETSIFKSIDEVKHSYFTAQTPQTIDTLIAELSIQSEFCFDTETTGVNAMLDELVGMSFSWKSGEGWYVPVPDNQTEAIELLANFIDLFSDEGILKIGQNLKFDMLMLKRYGIDVKGPLFDTMVAHHLINPGLKHNMDYLSEIYLGYKPVAIESLIGKKGKGQGNMRDGPINEITQYAAEDADITFQLKQKLKPELEKESLLLFFESVEMPLISALMQIEYNGVKVDSDELKQYGIQLRETLNSLEKEILTMAGESFNIASPKQVGEILFDKLQIDDKAKKTKTGQYSTDEETLQKIKDKHPIVLAILNHRGLSKLLNTYVEAIPQLIHPQTHRVHTSYNQAIVVTGRLSSTNPNLQNIPIRDDEGREMRKAFVASDSDHLFLAADYSQVELRLMAHFSGDTAMIEAFRNGEDIHTATASRIFKVAIAEVTSDMRRKAKTANFGIIYGISAFGLAERLAIPRGEAKALIDGYFESFPMVKTYMDNSVLEAREKGFVQTQFNRKRYLPDINSRNAVMRNMAERNAINAPIQGTAADIIKIAMVKIWQEMKDKQLKSKMILQVHDELDFDVVKSELETMKQLIKKNMEEACQLSVPLTVDMGVGLNWLEAH